MTLISGSLAFLVQHQLQMFYTVTKKTGTFENPTKLKHFYGESTLLTVPLIHDY